MQPDGHKVKVANVQEDMPTIAQYYRVTWYSAIHAGYVDDSVSESNKGNRRASDSKLVEIDLRVVCSASRVIVMEFFSIQDARTGGSVGDYMVIPVKRRLRVLDLGVYYAACLALPKASDGPSRDDPFNSPAA